MHLVSIITLAESPTVANPTRIGRPIAFAVPVECSTLGTSAEEIDSINIVKS